jgi:predicted exporter
MPPPMKAWRVFSMAWTVLVVALLAHQAWLWSGHLKVDTDVLALLPRGERDDVAQAAMQRLADAASRRVVVLVGAPDVETGERAAKAYLAALGPAAHVVDESTDQATAALIAAFAPHRDGLLTPGDRAFLNTASPQLLTARAQALLHQPVGQRVGAWREDPLDLLPHFLQARALGTRVRPRDGHLWVDDGATQWRVVQLESAAPAFSFDGSRRLEPALAAAAAKAREAGAVQVVSAGVPRFAESAAAQASQEVSTVGLGSLLAILIVMWLAFRSLRPLVLMAVTVALGVAAGLSACVLVFGRVHLITLVFGASLVGVAEDYGLHYFANRQATPTVGRAELLWHHLPGLSLALATSIAGYLMLGLAPFPGLRQVALFSAVGLAGAFLGAVAWFPWLDRGPVRQTAFSKVWSATRSKWPVVRGARAVVATVALLTFIVLGLTRLQVDDDVRELSSAPAGLIDEQVQVSKLMGLPSPAQFFVVRGPNETAVLEREEALRAQLDGLVERGVLDGYEAVSAWVPSVKRQQEDRVLAQAARQTIERELADDLEAEPAAALPAWQPLTVAPVLKTPLGAQLGALWIDAAHGGPASIVMLRGLGRAGLAPVAALGNEAAGVRFANRTGELSALLGRSRQGMLWLLIAGYALVFFALAVRFRSRAWRALAPTLLASLLAVAVVGVTGEKLQLFHVLALWLLLGMGVDYGIFLLEHPSRQAGAAWLAVGLGAVSTLLSFGLLALSATPAIHAFGVAMAVGIGSVWALSPLFCDEEATPTS